VRRLTGHSDDVRGVAFSPDGKNILTASLDKTAKLWQTDYHDTIRSLCEQLTRDLTTQERQKYGIAGQAPTCPAP
jgi:WD40 repeat protein